MPRAYDESRNQELYAGRLSKSYSSLGGWRTESEWAAVRSIIDEVRGQSILDIGIGAGRTAGLLTLLSARYVAVDYSPALVERARAAYPNLDIRVGDATELPPDLPGVPFRLVMFSFNGIDSISHESRTRVMHRVHHVLEPGGWFVYSTLNRGGPYFNEKPWQVTPDLSRRSSERLARWVARIVFRPESYWRRWSGWWRLRSSLDDHGDWAMGPLSGPGSGLVVHWSTPAATQRELADAGLELVAAFEENGTPIEPPHASTSTTSFHVVARRPSAVDSTVTELSSDT